MTYGGFWKRLAAYIIDLIFMLIAMFVIGVLLVIAGVFTGSDSEIFLEEGAADFLSLIVMWVYYALMESSSKQATFGKMALGLKVTDLDGQRIGFGKATGRHFGKILSSLILLIGFVMIAFTKKKQGLHDIMAGCLVINTNTSEQSVGSSERQNNSYTEQNEPSLKQYNYGGEGTKETPKSEPKASPKSLKRLN